MKSTFAFCTALAAVTLSAIVATSLAAPDTKPAAAKKPIVEKPADPDEPKAPEAPGKVFTNSVDMILLAMPGDFWAGEYLVTQKEYTKVMGSNPSAFVGDNNPVDSISYDDAIAFCQKLSAQDVDKKALPEGYTYTLPTEGEWEALSAGTELSSAVTSQDQSRGGTSPVGSLAANPLGLYDIRGNLMEFCLADSSKSYRVLRGA